MVANFKETTINKCAVTNHGAIALIYFNYTH
jgi:hypothetical protein